ncbi:hypothetical protein CLH_2690 [Clostridium botulinum E3 str. Alaska E43]|nr:hypothetical protein CLH_2690 [Clostridium botulinum E3 str. Alaska E43]
MELMAITILTLEYLNNNFIIKLLFYRKYNKNNFLIRKD